jgi:hypothetical protein
MTRCSTPRGPDRHGFRPDFAALQFLQTARQLKKSAEGWALRAERSRAGAKLHTAQRKQSILGPETRLGDLCAFA